MVIPRICVMEGESWLQQCCPPLHAMTYPGNLHNKETNKSKKILGCTDIPLASTILETKDVIK